MHNSPDIIGPGYNTNDKDPELQRRRLKYASWLIECCDTVTVLTGEEAAAIYRRAEAGEFDDDLKAYARSS